MPRLRRRPGASRSPIRAVPARRPARPRRARRRSPGRTIWRPPRACARARSPAIGNGSASALASAAVQRLAGERRERALGVGARRCTAAIRREIELAERRRAPGAGNAPGWRRTRLELGARRFAQLREVVGEELHLLHHPALHDGVAFVESEFERLAVENLLVDPILHERGHLFGRRRWPTLREPTRAHLAQVVLRHDDVPFRIAFRGLGVERPVAGKQDDADEKDLQQRLAQPTSRQRGSLPPRGGKRWFASVAKRERRYMGAPLLRRSRFAIRSPLRHSKPAKPTSKHASLAAFLATGHRGNADQARQADLAIRSDGESASRSALARRRPAADQRLKSTSVPTCFGVGTIS